MVITCPSCTARYRLSPDKIKGRGAKITCPKCAHVFVVFSEEEQESGEAEQASPEPQATAADALAGRDVETTTGAFRAVGIDSVAGTSPTTTGKIRVVAPGPRKSRRAIATIHTNGSLPAVERAESVPPVTDEHDAPEEAPEEVEVPTNAADLDFREVGITTWKVKVAIGLIYDFSDIATLKKYLTDKKVTEEDLISHNAKSWVRIGDIEDLNQHFIETWKAAKAETQGKTSHKKPAKKSSDSEPASDSSASSGGRSSSFAPTSSSSYAGLPGSDRSSSTRSTRTASSRKKAPEPAAPSRTPAFLLAGVVVVGAVAWFALRPAPSPPTSEPPSGTSVDRSSPSAQSEADEIRAQIRERVEADRERMEEEVRLQEAVEAAEETTPTLEPVLPVTRRTEGLLAPPVREAPSRSTGSTPLSAPSARGPSQSGGGGDAQVTVVAKDDAGQMWFRSGKGKLEAGDFGSARDMLKTAVQKCPDCGNYWLSLAEAYEGLGENAKATEARERAQSLGAGQ